MQERRYYQWQTLQRKKGKRGGLVFYFSCTLGRDDKGKQIRKYKTWHPPANLTPAKARKMAMVEAEKWEEEQRTSNISEHLQSIPKEKETLRKDDFTSFVNDVWFPLQVKGNNRKPKTIAFYEHITKNINNYFCGRVLQEITAIEIERFLTYLRTEYLTRKGTPMKPKTVHHYYNTLHLIFGYAETMEIIEKNPMNKVKAPKKERRPVDAMSQEQTRQFLDALGGSTLDFQCMMNLLIECFVCFIWCARTRYMAHTVSRVTQAQHRLYTLYRTEAAPAQKETTAKTAAVSRIYVLYLLRQHRRAEALHMKFAAADTDRRCFQRAEGSFHRGCRHPFE